MNAMAQNVCGMIGIQAKCAMSESLNVDGLLWLWPLVATDTHVGPVRLAENDFRDIIGVSNYTTVIGISTYVEYQINLRLVRYNKGVIEYINTETRGNNNNNQTLFGWSAQIHSFSSTWPSHLYFNFVWD